MCEALGMMPYRTLARASVRNKLQTRAHRHVIPEMQLSDAGKLQKKSAHRHTHTTTIQFPSLVLVLPSQSLQELLRLAGLKGKGVPSPEMSKFWIR